MAQSHRLVQCEPSGAVRERAVVRTGRWSPEERQRVDEILKDLAASTDYERSDVVRMNGSRAADTANKLATLMLGSDDDARRRACHHINCVVLAPNAAHLMRGSRSAEEVRQFVASALAADDKRL